MLELTTGNHVFIDGESLSWAELVARAERRDAPISSGAPTARMTIVVDDVSAAFEAVVMMAAYQLDALLVGRDRFSGGAHTLLSSAGYEVIEYPGQPPAGFGRRGESDVGRIGLLTSGSTGKPKLVYHTWETLFTLESSLNSERRLWLVPYQVGTYAWYQLVTMGLFLPGQDLVPLEEVSGTSFVETALKYGVDSISSTPTLWRLAFLEVPVDRIEELRLKQITLGGEIIDQALLDRLQALFPDARITQIYASSEAGACIVVQDGKAGFPANLLEGVRASSAALRIRDGRLWVRSRKSSNAAEGRGSEWVDTGDSVVRRRDRVYFLGRASTGMINVGGTKLSSGDIEAVILRHPAVLWCRVRGVRAPLVGNLPEVDYVVSPGYLPPTDAELMAHCRGSLPDQAVPRLWKRLDSIPVRPSLKAEL